MSFRTTATPDEVVSGTVQLMTVSGFTPSVQGHTVTGTKRPGAPVGVAVLAALVIGGLVWFMLGAIAGLVVAVFAFAVVMLNGPGESVVTVQAAPESVTVSSTGGDGRKLERNIEKCFVVAG